MASRAPEQTHFNLLAFGVRVDVSLDPEVPVGSVTEILPPGWTHAETSGPAGRLAVEVVGNDVHRVVRDDVPIAPRVDLGTAIGILDAQIRMVVAVHAPALVFIHAGCVAVDGRVIVLPGSSFAGKTTLVEALLKRGATYYSDEYAVLDDDGGVHPYPKLLSVRSGDPAARGKRPPTDIAAADLGAAVGTVPLPMSVIAAVKYRPAAGWKVESRSPGRGALLLLANALAGQAEPARVLPVVRLAATSATVVEGERGDADAAADAILDLASAAR